MENNASLTTGAIAAADVPIIALTPDQQAVLAYFVQNNQLAEGYRLVDLVLQQSAGVDPNVAAWFHFASHVNKNDGSYLSEFTRNEIIQAGRLIGHSITRDNFQRSSDELALGVLSKIADKAALRMTQG